VKEEYLENKRKWDVKNEYIR